MSRHIPVLPSDSPLLGFHWDNQFSCERFLPFGLRTAPYLFVQYLRRGIPLDPGSAAHNHEDSGHYDPLLRWFLNSVAITLAGIACIIMRKVYATTRESICPNPSFLSRDFPEASWRLLRNHEECTFQDMSNWLERGLANQFSTLTNAYALCIDRWISHLITAYSWYNWYVGI